MLWEIQFSYCREYSAFTFLFEFDGKFRVTVWFYVYWLASDHLGEAFSYWSWIESLLILFVNFAFEVSCVVYRIAFGRNIVFCQELQSSSPPCFATSFHFFVSSLHFFRLESLFPVMCSFPQLGHFSSFIQLSVPCSSPPHLPQVYFWLHRFLVWPCT